MHIGIYFFHLSLNGNLTFTENLFLSPMLEDVEHWPFFSKGGRGSKAWELSGFVERMLGMS